MISPFFMKVYDISASLETLIILTDKEGNVIDDHYTESETTKKCKEFIKKVVKK